MINLKQDQVGWKGACVNRQCVDPIHSSGLGQIGLIPRHGLAAMITLVAVSVVTIGSVAYLAARASAPDASGSVAQAAAARANAETGIELATAIMKIPDVDWRTKHIGGVLVDAYDYGGGSLTVTVEDPDGNPPTASTEYVTVTASGEYDGIVQMAEAKIYAPVVDKQIDVDLSEFAVFTTGTIIVSDSTVARWEASTWAEEKLPIYLGTNSIASGCVKIQTDASICDARIALRGDASSLAISDTSGSLLRVSKYVVTNNQALPVPAASTPTTTGLTALSPTNVDLSGGGTSTRTGKLRASSLSMSNGSILRIGGSPGVFAVTGNVTLDSSSRIEVDGTTDLVIGGNLTVSNGAGIFVNDGATVRVFVVGSVTVDNGRMGWPTDWASATNSELLRGRSYFNPQRFALYRYPGSASGTSWTIRNTSPVCGIVYAPSTNVGLNTASRVFGHIVASQVTIQSESAVMYDPALNTNRGYTNPDTVLYSADKTLDSTITALITSLDTTTQALVDGTIDLLFPVRTVTSREVKVRSLRRLGMRLAMDSDDAEIDDDGLGN